MKTVVAAGLIAFFLPLVLFGIYRKKHDDRLPLHSPGVLKVCCGKVAKALLYIFGGIITACAATTVVLRLTVSEAHFCFPDFVFFLCISMFLGCLYVLVAIRCFGWIAVSGDRIIVSDRKGKRVIPKERAKYDIDASNHYTLLDKNFVPLVSFSKEICDASVNKFIKKCKSWGVKSAFRGSADFRTESAAYKKHKRRQALSAVAEVLLWAGIFGLITGAILKPLIPHRKFEDYAMTAVVESYQKVQGGIIFRFRGEEKKYAVNDVGADLIEGLNPDSLIGKTAEIVLYNADSMLISQIRIGGTDYLKKEDVKAGEISRSRTATKGCNVLLGVSAALAAAGGTIVWVMERMRKKEEERFYL